MEEETSSAHQPVESGSLGSASQAETGVSVDDDNFQEAHDELPCDHEESGELTDKQSLDELINTDADPSVSDNDSGLLQNADTCGQNGEEEGKGVCGDEQSVRVTPTPPENIDVIKIDTGADDEITEELRPGTDNELPEQPASPPGGAEVVEPEAQDTDLLASKQESEPSGDKEEKDEDKPKDEWLDILGNRLLMKKTLQAGKGNNTRPTRGQKVTLKADGALEDGTPVDCHDEVSFIVGDGDIISAWDICVTLMQLGEVCELKSDSKYCYGSFGSTDTEPTIPASANLTYVLELMAVEEGPDIEKLSNEERISLGEKKKCYGNKLYSRGDYSSAINVYTRALKYLEPSSSEDVISLKVVCWNNLAACQLKIKAYQAAHNSCLQVLNIEPNNVKALYRKGKVLSLQGEYDEAMVYIKKANVLDPNNKAVSTELNSLRKQQASQLKKEKDMYQRMVSGMNDKKADNKTSKSSLMSWQVLLGATMVAVGGILAVMFMNKHQ